VRQAPAQASQGTTRVGRHAQSRDAVARVTEQGARRCGDAEADSMRGRWAVVRRRQ